MPCQTGLVFTCVCVCVCADGFGVCVCVCVFADGFSVCDQIWVVISPSTRLAFGMVSHANEKQTTYALDIVMQHCRHVFDLHSANNLNI